jgi:hypothetical protein
MKRRILMLTISAVMIVATFSSASTPLNPDMPGIGNAGPLPLPCAFGPMCAPR